MAGRAGRLPLTGRLPGRGRLQPAIGGVYDLIGTAPGVTWGRWTCAVGGLVLLCLLGGGTTVVVLTSLNGHFERATKGSDSFGNTCGVDNSGGTHRFALDLRDRPRVMFFGNSASSLRICAEECPTVATNESNPALCLNAVNASLLNYVRRLPEAGILTAEGCLVDVPATVSVMNRCTPIGDTVSAEGVWIEIAAVVSDMWVRPTVWGTILLSTCILPLLTKCCYRPRLSRDFAWAAAATFTATALLAQWWGFNSQITSVPKGKQRSDEDYEGFVAFCTFSSIGVLFLWILLRWCSTKRSTSVIGGRTIQKALQTLQSFPHFLSLILSFSFLGATAFGSVYGWMATQGGCEYRVTETDADTNPAITSWTYECTGIVYRVMPWAPLALTVWILFLLQTAARLYGARVAVHTFAEERVRLWALWHTVACLGYVNLTVLAEIPLLGIRLTLWILLGPFENLRPSFLHRLVTIGRVASLELAIAGGLRMFPRGVPRLKDLYNHESRLAKIGARSGELFIATGSAVVFSFGVVLGVLVVEFVDSPWDAEGKESYPTLAVVAAALLWTVAVTSLPLAAVQGATEGYAVLWCGGYDTLLTGNIPQKVRDAVDEFIPPPPQPPPQYVPVVPVVNVESNDRIPQQGQRAPTAVEHGDSDDDDELAQLINQIRMRNGRQIGEDLVNPVHRDAPVDRIDQGTVDGGPPTDDLATNVVVTPPRIDQPGDGDGDLAGVPLRDIAEGTDGSDDLAALEEFYGTDEEYSDAQEPQARTEAIALDNESVQLHPAGAASRDDTISQREMLDVVLLLHRNVKDAKKQAREARRAQLNFPPYWELKFSDGATINKVPDDEMKASLTQVMIESVRQRGCCDMHGVEILSVTRIENPRLWEYYHAQRNILLKEMKDFGPPQRQEIDQAHRLHRRHEGLAKEINEVFLFHGTQSGHVDRITMTGLDSRRANNGLYGQGTYFADNACKSHQYTGRPQADKSRERCMFYCRVLLGDMEEILGPVPGDQKSKRAPNDRPAGHRGAGTPYDSILADHRTLRNGAPQVHREFIVFENGRVYPEYLIRYKLK